MTDQQIHTSIEARREIAGVSRQLMALHDLTVFELATKYEELFGKPSRSHNKGFLRKRIAWRIQELAEGGLSEAAQRRIEELAPHAIETLQLGRGAKETMAPRAITNPSEQRDPRLPKPGTILTRSHGGRFHRVTVLHDAFRYEGKIYDSLSALAREITGTKWNGYRFFGLIGDGQNGGSEN